MKKLFVIVLSILLLVSLGLNVFLYKYFKNEKQPVIYHDLTEIENSQNGNIKISGIITSQEKNNMIVYALYEPYSPGDWHTHGNRQMLFVVDGKGYYQEENKPVKKLKAGDIIVSEPNIKSWHGSTKDSQLEVIYVTQYNDNNWIKINEPVSEEEYNNIK